MRVISGRLLVAEFEMGGEMHAGVWFVRSGLVLEETCESFSSARDVAD